MSADVFHLTDFVNVSHFRNFSLLSFGDEAEDDEEQVDKATEVNSLLFHRLHL